MAGSPINKVSWWGTVVGKDTHNHDEYRIRSESGTITSVKRTRLRHRKKYTKAFVGVTGDRKHDTWSMRHFSDRELLWLDRNGVLDSEGIVLIATHSDNAGQHFKSSVSLDWLTQLLAQTGDDLDKTPLDDGSKETPDPQDNSKDFNRRRPTGWFKCTSGRVIKAFTWDFGCPGHGKGVWDGLLGMLKQRLRTKALEAVTQKSGIASKSGSIRCPYDCYLQLHHMFGGRTYEESLKSRRCVRSWTFFWAGHNTIWRPKQQPKHHRIEGIRKIYQYFVSQSGEVGRRRFSCWCLSCYAALSGEWVHSQDVR